MSFPSMFAVYCDDIEVLQFDIFERYYGKRSIKSKEEIEQYYKKQDEEKHKELEYVNEKIENMNALKEHPIKYILKYHQKRKAKMVNKIFYGAKELALYTLQFKKMSLLVNQALDNYLKQIKEIEARYKKYNNLESDLRDLRQKEEIISIIEPIFIKYKYRLETERHKLY